jgi:Rrf2 family protein
MLTKTSQYALRAILYLAVQPAGRSVRASDVAQDLGVPANYLSKILHALAREGLLVSERGPGGGFRLARAAREITVADAIEPFETLANGRQCLLGRPECLDTDACAVHERWKEVSEGMLGFFHETTVAELQETAPAGRTNTSRGRWR